MPVSIRPTTALWAMVGCLLLAALLRVPDLSSTPPGLHFDEAANAILAGDIGLRGERPIFIPSYTGKESLYFYIAGGLMALLGETLFTLRLTSALIGLLTVALTYRLGATLFDDRRIGLLAAIFLATSFWHLLFSRLGFRAISQPLLQGLTVWLLLRGLTARQQGREGTLAFALAGVALGLTAYTYLAARLFPILLLLAGVQLLPVLRRIWGGLTWLLAGGLLVLAPLLIYFTQFPDAFWVRIAQVGQTSNELTWQEGIVRSLQMFAQAGDPYWRFNIPGKPLFEPLVAILMGIGLIWLVFALRRPAPPQAKFGYFLLLLNPFIMLLPTALATSEILPSNLRAIGMLPFLTFLPAVGLIAGLDYLSRWQPAFRLREFGTLVIGVTLLSLFGWQSYRQYFEEWRVRSDVFYENDGDLLAVAGYLNANPRPDLPTFVASRHYQHPTLAFTAESYDSLRWLVAGEAFVIPADGQGRYIYPANVPPPRWVKEGPLAGLTPTLGELGPDGEPTFVVYELTSVPTLVVEQPLELNFGYALTLIGYTVGSGRSGSDLPLQLIWSVQNRPAEPLLPFVHVTDGWEHRWSQTEAEAYPAAQWEAGDIILQQIAVPLRAGMPPGFYSLRVGLFDPLSLRQIARFDGNGRYAGSSLTIPDVAVLPNLEPTLSDPPNPLNAEVGPNLNLLGFELGQTTLEAGEPFDVALYWSAPEDTPLTPLTARFELLSSNNVGRILDDAQPVHGIYPFQDWQTPAFVIDRQQLTLPLDLPAGSYRLNLRLIDPGDTTRFEQTLGELTVTPSTRLFQPPPVTEAIDLVLGEEIRLVGYTLTRETDNATLELVWQAEQPPAQDYFVFVHLLNPDGTCCSQQFDQMPQGGARPTGRWLTAEYVVDSYTFSLAELPPGSYPLEVGLFLPDSGLRLSVPQTQREPLDYILLEPLVIEE